MSSCAKIPERFTSSDAFTTRIVPVLATPAPTAVAVPAIFTRSSVSGTSPPISTISGFDGVPITDPVPSRSDVRICPFDIAPAISVNRSTMSFVRGAPPLAMSPMYHHLIYATISFSPLIVAVAYTMSVFATASSCTCPGSSGMPFWSDTFDPPM